MVSGHDHRGFRRTRPEHDDVSAPTRSRWLAHPGAGPDNLAVQAKYIGLLAQVEDQIVESFRHGGGVPYSEFPPFTRLMAEDSAAVHDTALLDTILPLVPGLTDRLQRGIARC
jgi:hypothetical protein